MRPGARGADAGGQVTDRHGAGDVEGAAEILEELAEHVALLVRDGMAKGLSRTEAERSALARFGDVETIAATCRDAAGAGRRRLSTWVRIVAATLAVAGLALAAAGPQRGPRLLGVWSFIVALLAYAWAAAGPEASWATLRGRIVAHPSE